jgi:hypothetical protein
MAVPEPVHPVPLEKTRERVMELLCQHYAVENLTTEELQTRLDLAARAASPEELRALVRDLPAVNEPTTALAVGVPGSPPATVPERQAVIAVMGGATRSGRWTPPRELTVIAVMGGADLDFREARLSPGVTSVNIFALMGGVQIVVPPGVQVEMSGIALMGGFEERGRTSSAEASAAPVLRIGGFVMMGGVEVDVRYPGETAGEAKRRHRELRRGMREDRRLGRGD